MPLSFDEYVKKRQGSSGKTVTVRSGALSFSEFADARTAGVSFDDLAGYGRETYIAPKTASEKPHMWQPTIEDYNEGAAAYVEKKQQQEEAKRGMFAAGLDILGNAAVQAQRAATGVYADQQQVAAETQRALEASGRFFDAKEQFDEARALQDWQGREEAVDEYQEAENNYVSKLIRSALIFNPGNDLAEQREKLNDQREKIKVRDIAAGNGPRALTGLDRADQVIGGTAKGIGADLSMTFGEFYRLYGNYPFNAPMGEFLRGENRKVWEEQQEQLKTRWKRVEDFAKTLSVDASASLETAKNGLGIVGQAGVDMAQNAIEMTFDHFAGMAVGSPLVVMFARVYGQATMEAQQQGVDVDTAAAYGLSKAAIEVATEKMFDLVGIYGGNGMGDEWVEDLVYKLADDSVGQWFLRTLLNASGEGAEEVVSSLMDPITQMILDPSLTLDSYGERLDTADAAYSAIIGATLGLFSAAHVGQHRAANAALEVRRNMAEELRSRGYSDNLSEQVAPTLAKAVMGEELTEAEQAELDRWPTAQEVLQDVETVREIHRAIEEQAAEEEPAAEDNTAPGTETVETETAPRRAPMTAEDYARRMMDAEPDTADIHTEEGRARLQSATANLGDYSDMAARAYDPGQDVGNYAAGMYEAAAIYGAAGADVRAAVQQARDGKIQSAMRVLTDNQVAIAENIGRQMREDTAKAAADVSAAYSVIRQQAAAIGTRAAQNTVRINAAVRRANSIGSMAMETFKAQRAALEAMVQANPELEDSEEYKRLFDEAKRNMETVQRMQRAVENLKGKRAKAEEAQRRVTEHKAGRVSYEAKSGSVGVVQYEAVDKAKLTETQKAVTRIAEAIAKATGLEIHVARFVGKVGSKVGGKYLRGQGGVIWLNIDANFKGSNVAVGSLTHELTHWLQEYAPEEYQQLKRVVLDEMTKDPARFSQIFGDRARVQPDLRPDALTDEMTANACQVLFMDEASVQRIVSENRSLGQKILDFFKSILSDIKAAFAEIDTSSDFTLYQEVRAAEGAIDQMRDLFVQAMHTATENLQAERTVQEAERQTVKNEEISNSAVSEAASGTESAEERRNTPPNLGDEKTVFARRAQFQRWDDTTDDTEEEKAGRELAYARIQSENAVLSETVDALRKLTAKQDNTIEKLQKRLQLTKTPEVRETDARNLARQLIAEHSSRADLAEVTAQIKTLGDYLLQTNTQDVSEDELKNRARQIAAGIIDAATEDINLDSERYQKIAGYIKGKKLSIDEDFLGELDAAGGYDTFRKSLFGSLTLAKRDSNTAETREDYTSVSQFYADMQSTYGKDSFPDVANEGEEIQILAQMLDAGKPTEVNPYEKYRGEATEELSNRIVMDALNGVLRPTPPTDADRQKSRRVALQQQIKALKAENKLSEREAGRLYATIYDLSVALDKAESRYTTLRTEADIRAAKVYQEGLARAAEIKASERARAADKIQELKEHYKEMQRNARERRENTASRNKIRRLIDRLNGRLKHPTANKYVPKELVQLTIDTLNLIDIDTGTGSKTMAEKLADIRTTYAKYQADEKYSVVYDLVTAQMLDNLEQEIRGTKLKDMNEKQLNMVYETLKSLMYVVDKAVNVRIGSEERNAFELSKEMTDETRAVPKAQTGWIREHAIPAHLRADVAFDRFGGFKKNSAWTQVARLLNDGQLKQTRLRMELSIPFAELFNNQKALADYTGVNAFGKIDSKKLVDVGLKDADGNAIPVTRDFMVALYLDLLNEGNRLHFIRGGKTVPDFQKYYDGKDAYGAGSRHAVGISEELSALYRERSEAERANYGDWSDDVKARIEALESEGEKYANQVKQTIEGLMTDYDRAWVTAIQQLMDVDSKRELNQTTMEVYGIEKAQVPNYFPLFSDKDFIASDMETVSQDISLENVGFMKERVKSGNPTRAVGSVWAVRTQIDRVAQYCGLMPAIRSFNKIYSKTQSGYADSLKKALNQQFGRAGTDYVENLIADLSGGRAERADEFGISRAIGWLRGNLARSTLTLNPRVALAQAASYPTAAAELGYKALGKALAHGGRNGRIISRADKELIAKWSPLLWYRMQGYSTPELGDIQGSNRFEDRVWRKFRYVTGWIQAVDGATVGRLWYAAEYWVQDNKPNLEKGSDAYYEAVAEKFNAVVEKTQPNYTTMQRAAILRNPNSLIKTLTMFMTQRLQNFNILYDAAGRYQKARADFAANGRNGVTQADVNETRTDMARAVTSQIAQAALFVGMKMFVDFLLHSVKKYRDKDTGDLTVKSVSLSALDAFCDTLLGNAIFGSELYSIGKAMTGAGKWYGISISGVDTVGDLIESIVNLRNANVKWEDASSRKAFYNRVLKVGTNGAQAIGYPLNNAVKMGQAVYYHIKDAANGQILSYESDANRTNAQKAEKWIRALEHGDETAAKYAKSLFDDEKKAISALKDALKDSVEDGERTIDDANSILVKAGMSKDDAFFKVQEWKTGDSGKYTAIKRAALDGDTAAFRQAMNDLTTHGVKQKDAQGYVKTFIRSVYLGGELGEEEQEIVGDKTLTAVQARKLLHSYAGLSVDDAVATVSEWDDIKKLERQYGAEFQAYGLTTPQARYYYDTAKSKVSISEYSKQVDSYGLDAVKRYYNDEGWRDTGLTMEQYANYAEQAAKCKGTDKNGDGKADRGTQQAQIVEVINSLNVSQDVKDAIYLKQGYSRSKLRSMPWH